MKVGIGNQINVRGSVLYFISIEEIPYCEYFVKHLSSGFTKLSIGGTIVEGRLDHLRQPDYRYYHLTYFTAKNNAVQSALGKHVSDLFGKKPEFDLELGPNTVQGKCRLPDLSNVNQTVFRGKFIDEHVLERVLLKYAKQNSAFMDGRMKGVLRKDSGIFQLENFVWQDPDQWANRVVDGFTGLNLILRNALCENTTVIRFLKRWLACEQYQNLKTLFIYSAYIQSGSFFDPDYILKEFETKPWDPTRRPQKYLKKSTVIDNRGAYLDDLHLHLDLVRESDNKVASISIQPTSFEFLVWG